MIEGLRRDIGIVGGGQLGRMLVEAGDSMGLSFLSLDPNPNSPAKQAGAEAITAPITDPGGTRRLAERSRTTTIEIEHVDAETLGQLSNQGFDIQPNPDTIRLIQDKLRQKGFISSIGLPVARYEGFNTFREGLEIGEEFGWPIVIKQRRGGFDGRGNAFVSSPAQLEQAIQKLKANNPYGLYAEEFIRFKSEIAIMVAKSRSGDIAAFDVVDSYQRDNICDEIVVPSLINPNSVREAMDYAIELVEHFEGAGVYGIEMFVTENGHVIINEVAPRVHNSGHYTIDANQTSQFEQHLLAITGQDLGDPSMIVPAAAMKNLLTNLDKEGIEKAKRIPGIFVTLYGKDPRPPSLRKVGHVTAVAASRETALARVRQAHALISG